MSCVILKTRYFNRWAKKAGLSDKTLSEAVVEMVSGLIDAVLGSGIVKKRIALPGQGKSGSTRTLLATNRGDRWIFVYGFEKNQRSNISDRELEALKMLAVDLLSLSKEQIAAAIDSGALLEVSHETNKN